VNWLISPANRVLKLDADVTMLAAAARVAEVIERGGLPGIGDDGLTWLRRLAEGPSEQRAAIIEAIASRSLTADAIAEVFDRYVRVLGSVVPPAEYGLLFCRLGHLDGVSCRGQGTRIHWRLVDREPATSRHAFRDPKLGIGARLRRGFLVSVDPELPAELGPATPGHRLRVGIEGDLEGSAAGRMPIRLGSMAAGLSARGALRLDFYCLHQGSPLVATALGRFLENAPNPFQLGDVSRELEARRLQGLRFQSAGRVRLSSAVKLGDGLDLIRGLPSRIGAAVDGGVGFTAEQGGEYNLLVSSAAPPAGRGAPIQVQIRRGAGQTTNVDAAIAVEVDFTGLYQAIRPQLERGLPKLQTLLDRIHGLMPPSRLVADVLVDRVGRWVEDDRSRALVERLLARSGTDDLTDPLASQVGRLLDTFDGLWVERVETAAPDLVDRLVSQSLSLIDAGSRALAMELLQPGIAVVLTTLRARLREHLIATVGEAASGDAFDGLIADLRAVGHRVEATAASASQRLEALCLALGLALQGYQNSLTRLCEAVASSEQAKLGIQLRASRRRRRGQALDLRLELDPRHPDAATVYQQVLTGSMQGAFEHARAGSGAVLNIDGELAGFAGVKRHGAMEIGFLGVKLSGERLFNGDLAVTADHSGNIAVHGRGESAAGIGVFGERRAISAVNVFDLAVARETRRMSLCLTLSQRNERLDDGDVTRFFDSLAADGIDLLPDALGVEAVQRLRALRDRDADHVVGGELRVWMALGQAELLRLLSVRDVSAGLPGNPMDREVVAFAAADAIVDAMQATGGKPSRELREMERLVEEFGLAGDVRGLMRKMVRRQTSMPGSIPDGSVEGVRFRRMQRMADRAIGFADLVETLREVYFSAEKVQSGAWDHDEYLSRQKAIDETLQFWFTPELEDTFDLVGRVSRFLRGGTERGAGDLGLLNQKVRPYTIALLRAVKLLTAPRIEPEGGAPLLAGVTFDVDGREETFALV
jgi:hypothetical protein